MERILIFIKHNFSSLWRIIEWGNGLIFSLAFKPRLEMVLPEVLNETTKLPFYYRRLNLSDANLLYNLIQEQDVSDLVYFRPHRFDHESIAGMLKNPSFLMMGAFDGKNMVGYFFLRFFSNKKCFVGRLIDKVYRGKGIGTVMNFIMYEIAWKMKFRCLSTISRNNKAVMHAHAKNPTMIILKELPNDYLLVEFVRKAQDTEIVNQI